ncbi:ras suppressor protein 1, rsu1, putative [Perkinsus marinus ATCC 50983]|uniref:Ras suppressor protein 1, rsu1, putative n=1 Tax=Perkinsus marinus (strain ATCC 50983 / TXsc) TaxID=423536 RepID=C5L520_PERM5|nr:ras suppressor protein 1, rsu1, putative [Perkinsus marinus ATCC 50983]EER08174.1 ras suppressor protein 1, rsu1, putative [Perkinsus marinus ATCC 50983]|eukprot:XP_002776358.1 ras suppressor protein 1, rsu1, putative [Perkinsus marinus ATCC 50983]
MTLLEFYPATNVPVAELSSRLRRDEDGETEVIRGRLERCRQNHKVKAAHLCGLRLNERTFPKGVLSLAHLRRLDLSYNNLLRLDEELVRLDALRELWLDGNPLEELPVSLHRLKHLELLSLQELPRLKNLPREYAELRPTLVDVGGLQDCPMMNRKLIEALRVGGMDGFFTVLEIKHTRRQQRCKLMRILTEFLYPFEDRSTILACAKRLTQRVKVDSVTPEAARVAMARLIKWDWIRLQAGKAGLSTRHGERILPGKLADVDEDVVLEKLKEFDEELRTREEVATLELRIKAAMVDLPMEVVHGLALKFKSTVPAARIGCILRNWKGLFPTSKMRRFTELRQKRELKKIREIFMDRYPASSKEVIDPVIDYFITTMSPEKRKRLLVEDALRGELPSWRIGTIEECLRLLREGLPLITEAEAPSSVSHEVS